MACNLVQVTYESYCHEDRQARKKNLYEEPVKKSKIQ